MPATDVFTDEWGARAPGTRRSLDRMSALLRELGDPQHRVPVLGVVGSKGKGTAATYASARLVAAGLRVATVTGPSHRSHRERVRVDGRSLTGERHAELGRLMSAGRDRLAPVGAYGGGYLSPSGLYLVAGLLEALHTGADACVFEAGQGGRRDDLALMDPLLVAMGVVFGEHVGVLGDTPAEIADEKAGVCGPAARAFLHLPQTADVDAAMRATVRTATGGPVVPEQVDPDADAPIAGSPVLAPETRPPGLSSSSAVLGTAAAERMLALLGHDPAQGGPARVSAVMRSVRTPGRLSEHRIGGTRLIVDSAIDRTGVRAALEHARTRWPRIDHVLVCLPDHKDVDGAIAELADLPVTYAEFPLSHLRFTHPLPSHWHRCRSDDLTPASVESLGTHVLTLGTVYFAGRILDLADADTDHMFDPPTR